MIRIRNAAISLLLGIACLVLLACCKVFGDARVFGWLGDEDVYDNPEFI